MVVVYQVFLVIWFPFWHMSLTFVSMQEFFPSFSWSSIKFSFRFSPSLQLLQVAHLFLSFTSWLSFFDLCKLTVPLQHLQHAFPFPSFSNSLSFSIFCKLPVFLRLACLSATLATFLSLSVPCKLPFFRCWCLMDFHSTHGEFNSDVYLKIVSP